ncbi:hypothetical protein [Erythrobacter sp. Dej080120_24]|jgi:hypothetical protein|uniref:hypothetical protein n=1 Tax=Erythrobacter sp. Dej080120_24 TaxID=3024837 RepID=UPI0030C7847A
MARFLVQSTLILVVFIAAWRIGGKPERLVASIYATMLLASTCYALLGGADADADYSDLHGFRFLLDLLALAGVVIVALSYDRWWTLWVGSVQFIAVMPHLLRMADVPLEPIVYAIMERWPVWIAVGITGFGTFLHSQRAKAMTCSA